MCYNGMFNYCTGIKLSSTNENGYGIKWRIPATGTVTTAPTDWNKDMLQYTGGAFKGNPAINTTYYLYGVAKYTVTHNLTNLTATEDTAGADKADTGTGYATVLTADSGYVLPQTIAVTIDGEAAAAGTDYTYSSSTGTVTVTAAKVTGDIVITAAGVSATYTATVTPDGRSFGSVTVGYSSISAATFTIESIGTGALGGLSVALTGGSADSFTLDNSGTATALDASGGTAASTTFTVKPNDGLTVGDYTATIEVTASNLTKITKTVSFSVTAALSSGGDPYFRTVTVYNDYNTPGKAVYLTGQGLMEYDELIIEPLSSGKTCDRLKKLAGGAKIRGVYDISLAGGQLVYSRSPLTLHFNLETEYGFHEFTLIHIKADGTTEYIYATADLVGDLHFYPIYDFSPNFMLVEGTVKP